jgi:hypothetical protein
MWFWETRVDPGKERLREFLDDQTLYDNLEYLYDVMKQQLSS